MDTMQDRKQNRIRRTPKILSLTGLVLLGGAVAAALAQQAPLQTQSSQQHQSAATQSPSYAGSKGLESLQSSKQNQGQQLLQLERKFQSISKRIATAQEKAAQKAAVKKQQAAFEKALFKKMVQSAPDRKAQIDQFDKLGKELQGSAELRKSPLQRSTSFDQKLSKYEKLYAQLGPIEQQAAKDQQVAKLRTAYVQKLVAEMKKIEPQTDSLLRQRQQLAQTIRSLQSQHSAPPAFTTRPPSSTTSHNALAHGGQKTPPNK